MNALTEKELLVFNNLSVVHDPNVKLGNRIQEVIASIITEGPICPGTPANAVAASETLTITGDVFHGDTVYINNKNMDITVYDVYEFLTDEAQIKGANSTIAVDIREFSTASTGILTMDVKPTSGDKVTIGAKVFTFVPVGTDTADGEISIGADLAGAQAAFVAAINGTDGINTPHPMARAGAFAANKCTLTALIPGVSGDYIDTLATFTAVTNKFDGTGLSGGADCSYLDATAALKAAINAHDTQGVAARPYEEGVDDVILLMAKEAGADGNNIFIGDSMANGDFNGAYKLSGGVNGTVSDGVKIMIDDTHFHICIAANPVTGTNWRSIAF